MRKAFDQEYTITYNGKTIDVQLRINPKDDFIEKTTYDIFFIYQVEETKFEDVILTIDSSESYPKESFIKDLVLKTCKKIDNNQEYYKFY